MKTSQKNISIISKDCKLKGDFDFKGYLIIGGSISGTLNAETVITEKDSHITANIKANLLTIAGFFKGEVEATDTLTLLKTANVSACIKCGKLIIEEGCTFNGKIKTDVAG
ncbi:MAG: polymer-forming cytoskeletal protein [Bacteroidales bacterium]|nr:polymer-forming cytoskeletal protein [Bacteroidales bacterium]